MSRSRAARIVAGSMIAWSAACADAHEDLPPFATYDSAGIVIAESQRPAMAETMVVDTTPLFTIPNDFAEPEAYLFDVRGIVPFGSGGFVVGSSGSRELHYFDDAGVFVRAAGGPGDGPGELQSLFAMAGCEQNRVAIQERSRYSLFDADGRLVETVPVAGHIAERSASLIALSSDCASALVVVRRGPPPPAGVTVFVRHFPMYWVHLTTGERWDVGDVPALDVEAVMVNGRPAGSRRPFGREAVWGAIGEEAVLGLAFDFEVSRVGRDGQPSHIVRWAAETEPVTDADWEYFVEEQEEYRRLDPEEAQYMRSPDEYSVPSHKPPYSRLITDDRGRLWLQKYGRFTYFQPEPTSEWWVFDHDGRWVGTVHMVPDVEVHAISGDRILGVRRDELDLEEIVAYRVPPQITGSR